MIRIGVVEDDPLGVDVVLSHLDRLQRETGERFQIGAFSDGAEILRDYQPHWDLLLLDIQMADVDGMRAARRIREVDSEVIIIFITSSPQYAVSGYEVSALSYLLKPVGYAAFAREMERGLDHLRSKARRDMLFSTVDGVRRRVDLDDVLYLESMKHKVAVQTVQARHIVASSMRAMEAELAGDSFFRIHSGYLVNLHHVVEVEGNDCRVRGGARLQISRARKQEFLSALAGSIGTRGPRP